MRDGVELTTSRMVLRHWRDEDFDAFFQLNNDIEVMEFFPYRRDETESRHVLERIREKRRRDGFGWCAAQLRETGQVIGLTGLSKIDDLTGGPEGVEIGWRFLCSHWNNGLASEAAQTLLDHAFEDLALNSVVALAVHDNTKSLAVMRKIGMQPVPHKTFDHPGVPDSHPHLKKHVVWQITTTNWHAQKRRLDH